MQLLGLRDFGGDIEAFRKYKENMRNKLLSSKNAKTSSTEFRSSMKAKCDNKEETGFTKIRVENGCEIPCGTSSSLGFELKPDIEDFEPGELPPNRYGRIRNIV